MTAVGSLPLSESGWSVDMLTGKDTRNLRA